LVSRTFQHCLCSRPWSKLLGSQVDKRASQRDLPPQVTGEGGTVECLTDIGHPANILFCPLLSAPTIQVSAFLAYCQPVSATVSSRNRRPRNTGYVLRNVLCGSRSLILFLTVASDLKYCLSSEKHKRKLDLKHGAATAISSED
jgi:hypothetical protein